MAVLNVVRRFASVVIICTLSLLFMRYAGPSPTPSAFDWLVPWGFLVALLSGFVWATLRFKIPRAKAADTLSNAISELKERSLRSARQTTGATPEVAQANGQESTEDSGQQDNRENGNSSLEVEDRSRCPEAVRRGSPL